MKQPTKNKRPPERLTEENKGLIIESYGLGIKPRTIAAQIKKSVGAIKTFYCRWKLNSTLPPKEKNNKRWIKGRLPALIRKTVLDTPKLGVRKRGKQLADILPEDSWIPSKSTIHRFLQENNFKKRNPSLKCPLSDRNKTKRLEFARKWLREGECTLENVIWTDESRVASNPNNRKVQVWTNTGEVPIQEKMHSGGNSVMFWGSFSKYGCGKLVSFPGILDSKKYIELLNENLIPELRLAKESYPGTWRIMQDNAPIHTANNVKAFLRRKRVEFIDWPPYSPDLNPIENIWHWMKHILETEYPVCNSAEEIEARFHEIWSKITPEMCSRYCSNYEKRLLAVIAAEGGYTKY